MSEHTQNVTVPDTSIRPPAEAPSKYPIRLYILCHNQARYDEVLPIYSPYPWAFPIVMKYQDASFENAFWKQLLELYNDWKDCDMVGALSSRVYMKKNLPQMDKFIRHTRWTDVPYFHFMDMRRPINLTIHPNMRPICEDIAAKFGFRLPSENWCNYWMCRPYLMLKFTRWFEEELRPFIFAHPLAMTDAKYWGGLTPAQCLALTGVPYYPHVPFVLERMNKCFFDKILSDPTFCA